MPIGSLQADPLASQEAVTWEKLIDMAAPMHWPASA